MTDWRYQGQGMRRRMGAPSSHLDAANQDSGTTLPGMSRRRSIRITRNNPYQLASSDPHEAQTLRDIADGRYEDYSDLDHEANWAEWEYYKQPKGRS